MAIDWNDAQRPCVWRLMDLSTGGISERWWATENDAAIYAARLNLPEVQSTKADGDIRWVVVSDEPTEPLLPDEPATK